MQAGRENRNLQDVADFPSVLGREKIAENCVEYYLFIIDNQLDHVTHIKSLEVLKKAAIDLCQKLTSSYIWQRDEFSVELKTGPGACQSMDSLTSLHLNPAQTVLTLTWLFSVGLVFLYGITDYGEAIEDEWLIVYMLRELTKLFPHLWVRVADTDGEFLLIEAANALPNWINPEIDKNRVWLHNAQLHIIPVQTNHDQTHENIDKISLRHAVDYLRQKPNALLHFPSTEEEAFYRLQKYPDFVKASTHYSRVIVPRKIAYVLHTVPKSIAMAIEMFYLRDAVALRHITSEPSRLVFPPDDPVTISVQFSKLLFAQIKSQHFEPPPEWRRLISIYSQKPALSSTPLAPSQIELGMKITIGYELLSRAAKTNKHRVVRELDIILQDLLEDEGEALPTDTDIAGWQNNERHDDDRWLDINFSEFERQLGGRRTWLHEEAPSGTSDPNSAIDLQKIVSRVEQFLHDEKAGVDGVVIDEMDDENDDDGRKSAESIADNSSEHEAVELDEKKFAQLMRDITNPLHGFAAIVDEYGTGILNDGSVPAVREVKAESNETQRLMAQVEAELKRHGALNLNSSDNPQAAELNKMETQAESSQPSANSITENDDDMLSIDYHLAKNILESFKSQAGMAGPASNLLGMMGLRLPRDEED
ncbi:hypothetical protein E4U21_005625 [Claviceps maximensis]|nr:hypothetical protein E4U21_005625 [Claviceps maximensis]